MEPTTPTATRGPLQLSREDISRIVKSATGCYTRFRRYTRKNGEVCTTVNVVIDKLDGTAKSLGNLDDVAKLDEEALRQLAKARLATRTKENL